MGLRIWSSLALLLVLCCSAFQPRPTENRHPPRCLFASSSSSGDNNEKRPLDCLREAIRRVHALQQNRENNLLLLRKHPIRIGPSSIPGAGTGVFATKNIKAGTIVGFYPVHGIGLERFDTNAIAAATKEDQDYFDQQNNDELEEDNDDSPNISDNKQKDHNYLHFLIGSRPLCGYQASSEDEGGTLFVDVNPNRQLDSQNHGVWISHLVNDGAIVESNSEEGLLDYYRLSRQRKNCVTIPFGPAPILATVSTQKIKKDDELFTTYGGSYWLDSLLEMTDDGTEEDEEEEEPVDITETVQLQAKQTAQDLFDAVQNAKVAHAGLQTELEALFSSPLI